MGSTHKIACSYEARPTSIGSARAAVAEFGQTLGMHAQAIGDLRTVVGEACIDIVRHGDPAAPGTFVVEAFPEGEELAVTVRDCGERRRRSVLAPKEQASKRIGLALMASLTSRLQIATGEQGRTVIHLRMPLSA
jgi:anti-sigma regulatory factor (Ser/Thr protein kinase)